MSRKNRAVQEIAAAARSLKRQIVHRAAHGIA